MRLCYHRSREWNPSDSTFSCWLSDSPSMTSLVSSAWRLPRGFPIRRSSPNSSTNLLRETRFRKSESEGEGARIHRKSCPIPLGVNTRDCPSLTQSLPDQEGARSGDEHSVDPCIEKNSKVPCIKSQENMALRSHG